MTRRFRSALSIVMVGAVAALLLACGKGKDPGESTFPQPVATIVDLPTGLPQHLGLGLMNSPLQLDWMTASGIPWDYRYQYLTGGVNTGQGWSEWGDPAGSFVDQYLQDSSQNGYIPVFTYYQVVPSAPDPGGEDVAQKLGDKETMRAYFEDWEALMRELGAFRNTVIVHVEPDLWAYMEQDNGDAAKVDVEVKSTGVASVADFDDTAAGFAQALAHLRDLYAPKALLGFHVSSWAAGKDLILNQADPVETAASVAGFYRSLGVQFDLLFLDASDRDAGYYQVVRGDGGKHWWNDSDFARFRSFVGNIAVDAGRPVVLWQVPVGNTVYRSMDNTWGHYEDNRTQYWLGDRQHTRELADSGVIAVLFGAGADGCTMYTDEMRDGVTNPQASDGNDQQSKYADDDGGYLRLTGAKYYSGGPIGLATP